MCGRYVSVRSDADLLAEFDAFDACGQNAVAPDYNVAPSKPVRVIVNRPPRDTDGAAAGPPERQLRVAAWGLVPSWAKDRTGAARMSNARVESVPTRPAFGSAYAKRRCLIPADGWYEWQRVDAAGGPRKQPMYMSSSDGHGLAFAGLYEFWRGQRPTLTTCTIITTPAQGPLAEVHDRMPLLLPRSAWERWLDPAVADPADLLVPWDRVRGEQLDVRPVSTVVNKADNNGPELLRRVEPLPAEQRLF